MSGLVSSEWESPANLISKLKGWIKTFDRRECECEAWAGARVGLEESGNGEDARRRWS